MRSTRGDGGRNSGHSQGTTRRERTGSAEMRSGDSDVCDRAYGTGDESRWRRGSSNIRADDGGGRRVGTGSPLLSIGCVGGESEDDGGESGHDSRGDSQSYGKGERKSHGSSSGSGRALARGTSRNDGLQGLTRQVGLVKFLICVVRVSSCALSIADCFRNCPWIFMLTREDVTGLPAHVLVVNILKPSVPVDFVAALECILREGTAINGEGDEGGCQGQPIQL